MTLGPDAGERKKEVLLAVLSSSFLLLAIAVIFAIVHAINAFFATTITPTTARQREHREQVAVPAPLTAGAARRRAPPAPPAPLQQVEPAAPGPPARRLSRSGLLRALHASQTATAAATVTATVTATADLPSGLVGFPARSATADAGRAPQPGSRAAAGRAFHPTGDPGAGAAGGPGAAAGRASHPGGGTSTGRTPRPSGAHDRSAAPPLPHKSAPIPTLPSSSATPPALASISARIPRARPPPPAPASSRSSATRSSGSAGSTTASADGRAALAGSRCRSTRGSWGTVGAPESLELGTLARMEQALSSGLIRPDQATELLRSYGYDLEQMLHEELEPSGTAQW